MGSFKKIMQGIAGKLKNWEVSVAKKLIEQDKREVMNCPCNMRGIPQQWVKWWLGFGNNRTKWKNSLSHAREFLRSWTREQLWSDPRHRSNFYYSKSRSLAVLRFWIAAWYTEWYGYYRKRFWTTTCSRRTILYDLPQFTEFGIILSGIERPDITETARRESGMKRASVNTSIQSLHFQGSSGMLNHTGGTYSHRGYDGLSEKSFYGMESWKISWLCGISKLEGQLQNWGPSTNSRSSGPYALDQGSWDCPNQLTNLWHRDRLQGSTIFLISICLMRWLRQPWRSFSTRSQISENRVNVEEQRAQKHDRFLRGRQIACMIYQYFRATGAYDAAQGLSYLFAICLPNDDVQDFDVRWDHASLSASRNALSFDPGRILQVKIGKFSSISDCDGIVRSRNGANQGAELSQIEDSCKTSY